MFPLWVYAAVAAIIACLGFASAQVYPGLGIVIVILASTMWTAFAAYRGRRVPH